MSHRLCCQGPACFPASASSCHSCVRHRMGAPKHSNIVRVLMAQGATHLTSCLAKAISETVRSSGSKSQHSRLQERSAQGSTHLLHCHEYC